MIAMKSGKSFQVDHHMYLILLIPAHAHTFPSKKFVAHAFAVTHMHARYSTFIWVILLPSVYLSGITIQQREREKLNAFPSVY